MKMATFFGEIRPVLSRAVDSDSEDEETEDESTPFSCLSHEYRPHETNCYIFIGPIACGFATLLAHHLLYVDRVFTLNRKHNFRRKTVKLTQIVLTGGLCHDFMFILFESDINPEDCFHVTKEIFGCNPVEVTILCSRHISEYQCKTSTSHQNAPFVRAFTTNKASPQTSCPRLEMPNFVTNLPASLLTFSQIHNLSATAYVLYTDCPTQIDSINLEPFMVALVGIQDFHILSLRASNKLFENELRRLSRAETYNPMYT